MSTAQPNGGGRVAGKVAIVTGAANGIGEGMARALHAEGATVLLLDISGRQDEVASDLGEHAVALHVDVTDEAAIAGAIQHAVDEFGSLDVLCNNAGIDGRVMSINTRAVYAEVVGTAEGMTPVARIGTPAEIAAAAVFLASDESSFVTGAAIPVDGAYTAV